MKLKTIISLCGTIVACTGNETHDTSQAFPEIELTGEVVEYRLEVGLGGWRVLRDDGETLADFEGFHINSQFIGPTIRASLGDTIEVTVVNLSDEAVGLQPHGVHFDHDNDGKSRQIDAGATGVYTWYATEGAGTFFYNGTNLDVQYFDYEALSGILGMIVIDDPAEVDLYGEGRMFNYIMLDLYEPGITFNWEILDPADEVHNFTLIPQVVDGDETTTMNGMSIIGETNEVVRVNVLAYGEMYHVLHTEGHSWRDPHTGEVGDTWGGAAAESGYFYMRLDNSGTWRIGSNVDDRRMYMSSWLLVP